MRIRQLQRDLQSKKYSFQDLFKPENAQIYPLVIGGTRKQFGKLRPFKEDMSDFIQATAASLHPAQVSSFFVYVNQFIYIPI